MKSTDLFGVKDESDYGSSDENTPQKASKKRAQPQDASEDEDSDAPVKKAKTELPKKGGVIYFSSIPPYMKPIKLKQIISRFGEVTRIFLNPEDVKSKERRVKAGGNRKKKYVEGWAELSRRRDAKLAAESLNNRPIGGKKGTFYYDDILNVKYLKGFRWSDLTEGMALEAQERRERLKAEIAQATHENRIFMENVERKATIDRMSKTKSDFKPKSDSKPKKDFEPLKQRQVHEKKSKGEIAPVLKKLM